MRAGRRWRWARRALLVAILLLVGRYVVEHLPALRRADLTLSAQQWLVAATSGIAWVLVQSLLWRLVLRAVGSRTGMRGAIAQIWLPNLGKYVPGKVWAAVGRVMLCRMTGVPGAAATVALAIENVSVILGGAIFAALALAATGMRAGGPAAARLLVPVLATVIAGLVLVHPRVWGGAARAVLRRLGRQPVEPRIGYRQALALVAGYVISWTLLGVGMGVWAAGVADLPPWIGWRVAGLYMVAWSAGYVSMLAPAGIGVREGVMMAGLAGTLSPERAVLVALSLRVYFTLIDGAAALLAVGVAPRLARRLWGAPEDAPVDLESIERAAGDGAARR